MSITTDLVSECIRAANAIETLSSSERRLLLERGVNVCGALRSVVVEAGTSPEFDSTTEQVAEEVAQEVDAVSDATIAKIILSLAEEIRQMRILNLEQRLRRKQWGSAV